MERANSGLPEERQLIFRIGINLGDVMVDEGDIFGDGVNVAARLQTLAEATNRLSDDVKARHPEIRWRAIYGFRNIAAHGYLDLQIDRVWEIVEAHLPALKAVVDAELGRAT